MRHHYTNREKAQILSQPVLKVKDIRALLECGGDQATAKAKDFREWFASTYGYETRQIPTDEFVKFCNYPEQRVLKYAGLGY